jgi:3-hydroxyisobutyrate dehydrogenase-like beta-hydroxyacid dehydrogenase
MAQIVSIIGFGEAGRTFAAAGRWGSSARGFDVDPARKLTMVEHGVRPGATAAEALAGATLVLSLVTADQAQAVAEAYASALAPGALWCDMNSVAPLTKLNAARAVLAAGARYVDVAVMAPVNPAKLDVPLLLAGAAAEAANTALAALGFTNIRVLGPDPAKASAVKMIRSVMIKGIEALTDEMIAAAKSANVLDEVIASLDGSEVQKPWAERAAYNLERMATHGLRRAAEMEESVKTLESLGVDPVMTRGTVIRQRLAGEAK